MIVLWKSRVAEPVFFDGRKVRWKNGALRHFFAPEPVRNLRGVAPGQYGWEDTYYSVLTVLLNVGFVQIQTFKNKKRLPQ
jgi:hypothetical protein